MNTCLVDGCGAAVYGGGLCRSHYMRKRRHGDPVAGRAKGAAKGKPMEWIEQHKNYSGDECLIWPFFRVADRGYGRIGRYLAHRVMCLIAHGEPPEPDMLATHECGNGHGGCVNPRHLVWGSHRKNANDRSIHGTVLAGDKNHRAKLHWRQVAKIRRLAGTRSAPGPMTQQEVADLFGISQSQVSEIVRGASW